MLAPAPREPALREADVTRRGRQIAVIGKGEPDEALAPLAEEVGRRLAEAGAAVVCGGRRRRDGGGGARGASGAGGDVIGVLPASDPDAANPHCTHVVATGIGQARNLAVVSPRPTR